MYKGIYGEDVFDLEDLVTAGIVDPEDIDPSDTDFDFQRDEDDFTEDGLE